MKKKIMFLITGLLSIVLMNPNNVNAKMVAYSIGTDYGTGNINTSTDAINACEAYYSSGKYSSYYTTKPTYSYISGNNPNTNKPRLESDIVFLSGHGNYDRMVFNYLNKGGNYATGVYMGTSQTLNGYKLAGIKNYNMSNAGLVIYAGCLTGLEGVTNIAEVTYTSGATTTMGWRHSIEAVSHTEWLKRFNTKLGEGLSVWNAVDYANKFDYNDNDVKDISIYGNMDYVITSGAKAHYTAFDSESLKEKDLNIAFDDDKEIESLINEYIKNNINSEFDSSNYKVEKHSTLGFSYYDYKFIHNSYITNSTYTFKVDNSAKKIVKYIDNTIDLSKIPSIQQATTYQKDESTVIKNATNRILANKNNEIVSQKSEKIYDAKENKFKWYVRTEVFEKDSNTYYVDAYFEEI